MNESGFAMDPEVRHASGRPPTIGEAHRGILLEIGYVTVSGASGSQYRDQHGTHHKHSIMIQRTEYNNHLYNARSQSRADITSLVTHLNIVRTSPIISRPKNTTSIGDHRVIETRNMSAETHLQTVSGNTHEREGRKVSLYARRSKLFISKSYRSTNRWRCLRFHAR